MRPATEEDLSKITLIEKRVFRFPWSKDQIKWELSSQHVALNHVMLLEDNVNSSNFVTISVTWSILMLSNNKTIRLFFSCFFCKFNEN